MDPLSTGLAIASTALNFGSGMFNTLYSGGQTHKQRAHQTAENEKQRQWQEKLANTAHQREIADLKAAGINPLLSAMGSGAAVPGGAANSGGGGTTASLPTDTDLSKYIAAATQKQGTTASAELDIAKTAEIIKGLPYIDKKSTAEINNITADTIKKQAEKENIATNTGLTEQQITKTQYEFALLDTQQQQEIENLAILKQHAKTQTQKEEIDRKFRNTWFGRNMTYLGLTLDEVSGVIPMAAGHKPQKEQPRKTTIINYNNH